MVRRIVRGWVFGKMGGWVWTLETVPPEGHQVNLWLSGLWNSGFILPFSNFNNFYFRISGVHHEAP